MQKIQNQFKTPNHEKNQIIELTIDLSHPAKAITETQYQDSSEMRFLASYVTPKGEKEQSHSPLSSHLLRKKSLIVRPIIRNYKNHTHENPRKILKSPEIRPRQFYTEPNESENQHLKHKNSLANKIYSLEKDIKNHTKAVLDQNFSTAFTPNSKQTEEDFESQDICEAHLGSKTKIMLDSVDVPCQIRDLSKNVKYVDGGVGIKEFDEINEDFFENYSFMGKNAELFEEHPWKNGIKTPFLPILMGKPHKTFDF